MERIYYTSAMTVISLERTNLPKVFPRVYITAAGNALRYDCKTCLPLVGGVLEIGGAAGDSACLSPAPAAADAVWLWQLGFHRTPTGRSHRILELPAVVATSAAQGRSD